MDHPLVPLSKRVRIESQTEAKTLQQLAIDAFIEDARNRLVVDVSKIPKEYGAEMWKQLTFCELIQIALKSNAVEWFSKNVIEQPLYMEVSIKQNGRSGIWIDIKNRERFMWLFNTPAHQSESVQSDIFNIEIGGHVVPTWIHDRIYDDYGDNLVSKLNTTDFKIPYDVIEWLRKFFHCKINSFEFWNPNSDHCKYWDLTEERGDVLMYRCTDADFVSRVLPERERKKFSTTIRAIDIEEPITVDPEAFRHANVCSAKFNFTTSDFEAIVKFYMENATDSRDFQRKVFTKVPNWTTGQLEEFKTRLEFKDYSEELHKTHNKISFVENMKERMYRTQCDELGAIVVIVHEKEPGVYDEIGLTWWRREFSWRGGIIFPAQRNL